MHELITIVDENNTVVGSATRKEAQLKGLWHRIVVVYVLNSEGKVYIQKRASTAETSPNLWDHSAAGHVDADEKPDTAAKRELKEELGIEADTLEFIATNKTQRTEAGRIFNRYWYLYTILHDGEISLQTEEVAEGKFVDIPRLLHDLNTHPELYTDGLRQSLEVYRKATK